MALSCKLLPGNGCSAIIDTSAPVVLLVGEDAAEPSARIGRRMGGVVPPHPPAPIRALPLDDAVTSARHRVELDPVARLERRRPCDRVAELLGLAGPAG